MSIQTVSTFFINLKLKSKLEYLPSEGDDKQI